MQAEIEKRPVAEGVAGVPGMSRCDREVTALGALLTHETVMGDVVVNLQNEDSDSALGREEGETAPAGPGIDRTQQRGLDEPVLDNPVT